MATLFCGKHWTRNQTWSEVLLPTLSNAVHGLNKILALLLFYATNVLCGDMDGLGNYIYIGAFGNIIINSSQYNFPAATTDIVNCSINKKRN